CYLVSPLRLSPFILTSSLPLHCSSSHRPLHSFPTRRSSDLIQVEWLPWHHTMGGNVILHGILKNGGTLYIDDGRPLPQLFHKTIDRKSTRLNSSHVSISYAVFCLKKKKKRKRSNTYQDSWSA